MNRLDQQTTLIIGGNSVIGYAASKDASFITGTEMVIDGGITVNPVMN